MLGVVREYDSPGGGSKVVLGLSGSQAHSNSPVSALKVRTTPEGSSTEAPSCTQPPTKMRLPITVFSVKGVPGHRRERIETAVVAGGAGEDVEARAAGVGSSGVDAVCDAGYSLHRPRSAERRELTPEAADIPGTLVA